MTKLEDYRAGDAEPRPTANAKSSTWSRQQGRVSFSKPSSSKPRPENASIHDQEQEDAYFTELLSYSLERLGKEPELLKADQDHLRKQAEDSAVKHYKAFINTASCLEAARDEMQGLAGHVDALLQDIPVLDRVCEQFVTTAKTLQAKQSENKQLQSNHATMLELLEVPQLMDTCVRNGSYDDALDLKGFIGKLAFMHSDLKAVQNLVKDVDAASASMLEQLLQKLRSNIQLPDCLRMIGYLRRLGVFSEKELRLQFLQCREEYMAEVIEDLEEQSAYDYLKRLTDIHRLHLFDVVMQYRAIFSDDQSAQDGESQDGGLVFSWAEHRVCLYLEALRQHLPGITEGGSLASVLEHCMYCGMSLARVGLDIRGLLPPIFEACVLNLFSKTVGTAVDTFLMVLDSHKWTAMPSMAARSRSRSLPSSDSPQAASSSKPAGTPADSAGTPGGDPSTPPYTLMEHAPLAIFVNGLLTAFNELRHCAPLSLAVPLASILQEALTRVSSGTVHYSSARTLNSTEQPLFAATARALCQSAAPYTVSCYKRVYPETSARLDTEQAVKGLKELIQSWDQERSQMSELENNQKPKKASVRPPKANIQSAPPQIASNQLSRNSDVKSAETGT
ncbi:hypothetical protein ABBQ38_009127 [Trebouxia sp. C0009 RCD-2024]